MGKKTYAQLPNGKILNWIELLDKYNIDHNESTSAHTEWDKEILYNKKLPKVKVVIKNDKGEFEEISEDVVNCDNNDIKNTSKSDEIEDINIKRKVIDQNTRRNIWTRYWGRSMDGQCSVCGNPIWLENFDAGHIIPVSKGGSDNILNLVPICRGCNQGMKTENLIEYKNKAYSHVKINSLVQPGQPEIRKVITKEEIIEVLNKYIDKEDGQYFRKAMELLQEK